VDRDDERKARNQNIFRAGNEAIRANVGPDVDGIVLICECGDADCLERIGVRREEYESVRENPRAFILAVGHEEWSEESAIVVDENERFVVVEKLEAAGRIAEELYPRRGAPPDDIA
jgi:hypothetical protein